LLPDVNLWLALAFARHAHHQAAADWFNVQSDGNCHFCRATQQGFLRLATNPRVLGAETVTMRAAWTLYDTFLSDGRVSYAPEPPGLEPIWREYTQRLTFSPKVWNDAYLAAFARAAALRLVTFDRGLSAYANVNCVLLS
jgi:toxin-antitoxin system PIN domain toxin